MIHVERTNDSSYDIHSLPIFTFVVRCGTVSRCDTNGIFKKKKSTYENINLRKHGIAFQQAKEAPQSGIVVVLKEDTDSGEQRTFI